MIREMVSVGMKCEAKLMSAFTDSSDPRVEKFVLAQKNINTRASCTFILPNCLEQ